MATHGSAWQRILGLTRMAGQRIAKHCIAMQGSISLVRIAQQRFCTIHKAHEVRSVTNLLGYS